MGNYPLRIWFVWQTGSCISLVSHRKERRLKFSVFNLDKANPPSPLVSAVIAKSQGFGKKIVMNLSAQGTFCLLVNPSSGLTILKDGATRALPSPPSQSAWRNHSPDWELVSVHIDMEATLSVFKPTAIQ